MATRTIKTADGIVRFEDNSDIVLRQMGTNSEEAMKQVAEMLVEAVEQKILYGYKDVHGNPPHTEIVDTGHLFDSIDASVTRESQNTYTTTVGANTSYAVYVHEGTSKLKGRAFITDAVMDSKDKVERILSRVLPQGIEN